MKFNLIPLNIIGGIIITINNDVKNGNKVNNIFFKEMNISDKLF